MYDIIIIGAGVNGCSIARELTKSKLKITVLEKSSDVCEGTSKANSGITHAGYDAKTGTLKAKLNVRGSELMEQLSKDLGFGYRRRGSLVLCFCEEDMPKLRELFERGKANGVKDLQIISKEEALKLEPNLSDRVVAALFAPTAAIVDPFGLTVAMAENAAVNGAEFKLNTKVTGIEKISEGYRVKTSKGDFEARVVVNAAGVYADEIHNMVSGEKIKIQPRRGEYMLLDSSVGSFITRTVFQLPTALGKGVLITPSTHGNILVGPTADAIDDKEDTQTTAQRLSYVKTTSVLSAPDIPFKEVITSFAGLRARLTERTHVNNFEEKDYEDDFLIGEIPDAPGFFDVAGIESPGLSSAPAIAEYVAELIGKRISLSPNEEFCPKRETKKSFALSSDEERKALIAENPLYGNIICRCNSVTEAEIVNAIHSPVGATTTDGLKRRVYAGMGRCQAGFCNPKVVEILARELGMDPSLVTKNDEGSNFILTEENSGF